MALNYWDDWEGVDLPGGYAHSLATDGTYLYVGAYTQPGTITKIHIANRTTHGTYTGQVGEGYCYSLTHDGSFLYSTLAGIPPAKVVKINTTTMTEVGMWTSASGHRWPVHLDCDSIGGFLFVGFSEAGVPGADEIVKIDATFMTAVQTWVSAGTEMTCGGLLYAADNLLYASFSQWGGMVGTRVMQIDPSSMTTINAWTGPAGSQFGRPLAYGGGTLYANWAGVVPDVSGVARINTATMTTISSWAGVGSTVYYPAYVGTTLLVGAAAPEDPSEIYQIDPGTMLTTDTWTAPVGINNLRRLIAHATEVYASFYNVTSFRVRGVNAATMETVWDIYEEDRVRAVVSDGTYVYAALSVASGIVMKVEIESMGSVDFWRGTAAQDFCVALCYDGTYLYAGVRSSPAQVIKINPATMNTVATWTGAVGQNEALTLVCDDTFFYLGLRDYPSTIIKVNLATMNTVDSWVGGENRYIYGLVIEGLYLYAALMGNPAKVVKILISNMVLDSTWAGTIWVQRDAWAIASDGTYIYAGLDDNPAQVLKIDPDTMTEIDDWTGEAGQRDCNSLVYDGAYIVAGLDTTPVQIIQISPADMSVADTFTGASGQNDCKVLCWDGTWLFAGLNVSPGVLLAFGGAIAYLITAAIDALNLVAYFGAYLDPGVVAKIDLTTFTLADSLVMDAGDSYPRSSICSPFFNVFYGLNLTPGRMVDVEIPGFTEDSNQIFGAGQDEFWAAGDDPSGGVAYFSCRRDPGIIVRISRGDYTVNTTLTLAAGDSFPRPIAIDHDEDYAFVGLWTSPAEIVVIKLSTFLRQIRYQIPADINYLSCGVCDTQRNWVYFGAYMSPGKIIRVKYGS